jgi:O-antigen/teichoic acid export membrane protein
MTELSRNTLGQLLKESLFYALSKLIPGVVGLIAVVLFFRWVGPTEYGRYSMIFSFTNLLAAISFGWLNQSILRYGSTFHPTSKLFPPLIVGSVLGFLFISIVLIIFSQFQFPVKFPLLNTILLAAAIGIFNQIKVTFQSKESPKKVIIITSIQSILMVVCTFMTIRIYGPQAISIIIGVFLGYFIPCLGVTRSIQFKNTWSDKNGIVVKKFFKFGAPLSIWFGLSLSLNFLDRFFIERYYGAALMGSFAGFSEFIIRVFSIIIFPITLAIHPMMMNQWNKERDSNNVLTHLRNGSLLQGAIFGVIFVGIMLFKDPLFIVIEKLVPNIDGSMQSILLPLFIGGFLWQFALLAHKPLEIEERTIIMVICILSAVLINLLGNLIFLPQFGVIATAYTMIASASIYIILSWVFSNKIKFNVFTR